ncbi:uncharacterized protein cubi_00637 [Cryptosporidium ubiquitum]|uniref:Uncharacterized protein n=1 Tax=Cryptosporidium ubiquitum TaxID=857276 RepID=A0A1J4MG44_9CRYT|nr:uncharacterized protein cubi_00637 [Cryptosporidium ubiquitum]OII71829.1 hypothetical protein cubi_00637 [Cryptosporidium ubiquitum]
MRLSFCIFIFVTFFDISFVASRCDFSTNLTAEKIGELFDENCATISLEKLVFSLKVLLSDNQKMYLAKELLPKGFKLTPSKCEDSEVYSDEVKEIYEGIISQNLTKISVYELLHVPELMSNATHLRRIRNTICSPRPVRPRRHIKNRNPSNVPGASPYVVYEGMVEMYNSDSSAQVGNQSLSISDN